MDSVFLAKALVAHAGLKVRDEKRVVLLLTNIEYRCYRISRFYLRTTFDFTPGC